MNQGQKKRKSGLFLAGSFLVFSTLLSAAFASFHNAKTGLDSDEDTAFLPPKIMDSGGFLDGTERVSGALIDPSTDLPASDFQPGSKQYDPAAIRGTIQTHSRFVDGLSDAVKAYGRGGDVSICSGEEHGSAGIHSAPFLFESGKHYSIEINVESPSSFPEESYPSFSLVLAADFGGEGSYSEEILLLSSSRIEADVFISESAIHAALWSSPAFLSSGENAFSALFRFKVSWPQGTVPAPLYLSAFHLLSEGGPLEDYSAINWEDSTKMLSSTAPWVAEGSTQLSLHASSLLFGDFRYDDYFAALGTEDSGFKNAEFSEDEINAFILRGWMKYDWAKADTHDVSSFEILDSTHCPVRDVYEEVFNPTSGFSKLIGLQSPYRYLYYRGVIDSCVPPKYFFGTDSEGRDVLRIVSAGLLVSLGMGLSVALISFALGGFLGHLNEEIRLLIDRRSSRRGLFACEGVAVLALAFSFFLFTDSALVFLCLVGSIMVERTRGIRVTLHSSCLFLRSFSSDKMNRVPNTKKFFFSEARRAYFLIPATILFDLWVVSLGLKPISISDWPSFGVVALGFRPYWAGHPYLLLSSFLVLVEALFPFLIQGLGWRASFSLFCR